MLKVKWNILQKISKFLNFLNSDSVMKGLFYFILFYILLFYFSLFEKTSLTFYPPPLWSF